MYLCVCHIISLKWVPSHWGDVIMINCWGDEGTRSSDDWEKDKEEKSKRIWKWNRMKKGPFLILILLCLQNMGILVVSSVTRIVVSHGPVTPWWDLLSANSRPTLPGTPQLPSIQLHFFVLVTSPALLIIPDWSQTQFVYDDGWLWCLKIRKESVVNWQSALD